MKKTFFFFTFIFFFSTLFAEDFYLPLTGFSKLEKSTKKTTETKAAGVCCLVGTDMFIFIDRQKIDCQSIEKIQFQELSNNTMQLSVKSKVSFNCDNPIEMKIVLNFVNKVLTNVYLFGKEEDFEFYLGNI